VWRFDMIKELGVFPHSYVLGPNRHGSPAASYGNRIYVVTGNGTDLRSTKIPASEAPSLVCFDKDTGKVLWTDASPGTNILRGQIADPLVIEIDGRGQVIVGQGDGWIRSFGALTGRLIWKFDINAKEPKWDRSGRGTRNSILATPVFYKGRVYIGSGEDTEHSYGPGRLVCIDPTRTGDISSELALDAKGRALPHRRFQAVLRKNGEKAIPNPNSGLVWEYTAFDQNRNGKLDYEEVFHSTMSSVVIKNDLLIAADSSGLVHCFHAKSGKRHWVYDAFAQVISSPLIVDDRVYVADEDGEVAIFRLSSDPDVAMKKVDSDYRPLSEIAMDNPVNGSPVFANGVLYIASRRFLWAIAAPNDKQAPEVP
jgi:outer membrane protein assembly factor BamB